MASLLRLKNSPFYYARYRKEGRYVRRSTKERTLAAAQRAADRMEAEAWMKQGGESPEKLKDEFLKWAIKRGIPESKALDWIDSRTSAPSRDDIIASLTRLEAKFDRIEKILRAAFDGVLDLRGLIG
jgi:hypothetical protein